MKLNRSNALSRRRPRALGAAAACAWAATVGGCAAPTVSFTVSIRDAQTHAPVTGAVVVADTPSRDHPFSVASIFGLTGPRFDRVLTDARGCARLTAVDDRPVRVGVLVPARQPMFIMLDGTEGDCSRGWMRLSAVEPSFGGSLELRVDPGRPTGGVSPR